jgi:arylsulfatase A-like enzyme
MFGKYLNSGGMNKICPKPVGDGSLLVPKGWTDFLGACPDTCYVNCTYNNNGNSVAFTDPSYPNGSNYGTTVIGNMSLAFIRRAMAANAPFMAYVASHAPHGPATPSPTYEGLYSTPDVIAPRTPSYGVHSADKHWVVAVQPTISATFASSQLDDFYKNRMRSLRSVDDIVHDAHAAVGAAGQMDNTWWFFSSDHGLHLGQFCLGPCKRQPYDTDIRIPFRECALQLFGERTPLSYVHP